MFGGSLPIVSNQNNCFWIASSVCWATRQQAAGRQAGRQADKPAGRQADRQAQAASRS